MAIQPLMGIADGLALRLRRASDASKKVDFTVDAAGNLTVAPAGGGLALTGGLTASAFSTFNAGVQLSSTVYVAGVASFANKVGIGAGQRLYHDGAAATGDTYAAETAPNQYEVIVGGQPGLKINPDAEVFLGTSTQWYASTSRLAVESAAGAAIEAKTAAGAATFVQAVWNNASAGDNSFIAFFTEAVSNFRGAIDYDRASGQVRYGVTSDGRIKSDVEDAQGGLDFVRSTRIRRYGYKGSDAYARFGFVAQELWQNAAFAVRKGAETRPWMVDPSKLVAPTMLAVQELDQQVVTAVMAIEELTRRVTALEDTHGGAR